MHLVVRSAARSKYVLLAAAAVLALSGCGGGTNTGTGTCGSSGSGCPTSVPSILSSTPAGGTTGVSVTATVTATFDMAMDASTLTTSTFTLSSSGGAVSGAVTYSSDMATFTPSAALAYNTAYTATITTGATSTAGGVLAANYSWSFTTAAAPAPTVTTETPASGAANVSVGSAVMATFSEAMEASTLTANTFTLTDSTGNSVSGAVTYDASSDKATLTPSSALSYATTYTATITTGATAANGAALTAGFSWQFTTEAAPAAPQVTATTPASGATSVAVSSAISATFSEAMNASSFTALTFTVQAQGGGSVAGTVSYNATTQTATFTPSSNLSYGTTYTATLTTAVTSATGQALAANDSWSFTTVQAPAVLSMTPTNGATGVAATTDITATFSMAMNPATLTTSTFTLSSSGGQVAGMVSYAAGSDTATFTPSASLSYNTVYTATITTDAQNSGGVGLAANDTWSFTTEAAPSGTVTVDFGTQEQIIRGFGGSTAWLGQLTTAQANELFSTSELGLSILRVRIDPTGSASTSPPWATSNWAQELQNAIEAQSENANTLIIATPWTPPASLKTSGANEEYSSTCSPSAGFCGGYLAQSNYAAYAGYLEDFVTYFRNGGVNLYGISLQNEPDANVTYESCYWAPTTDNDSSAAGANMDTWIASDASVLTTKLIMPESESFNQNFATDALNDPSAVGEIGMIGGHLYGISPFYYTAAENAGKEVWMTEHYLSPSGSEPTITDALAAAEEINNSMVIGQYNAYVWWWIWNDDCDGVNYGLITDGTGASGSACGTSAQPAPTYYGYAMGQFSKFIQPGYYRYNLTAPSSSTLYFSAYGGSGHYVIVAINSGSSSVSQPFTIQNGTVTSMTPWQTTTSGGLQELSPVTVSSGQFTYTLPAQSITTFVQ